MSSQNNLSLEDALNLLMQEVSLDVVETSYSEVTKISKRVATKVDQEYEDFFYDLYNLLGSPEVPNMLAKYLGEEWKDITRRWSETKDRAGSSSYNDFYRGITRGVATRTFLGRGKNVSGTYRTTHKTRKPAGRAKVEPFAKYIQSLQDTGATQRFFGPVSLSYEFQSPDVGTRISVKMGPKDANDLSTGRNEIRKIFAKNIKGGGFARRPDELRITANIRAFEFLEAVDRTEKAIVDLIIKRIDPKNEKQWVKINGSKGGRGRGNRPIRPLIQPLVQYYINEALPDITRAQF